ncbi:phosphatidylcholine-sterol acyltransferase [Acrasis kona]|uniref:Phosphatidylcholine-sterol acyltransferase n=1 Tax=Acrasis kona TaxID=1008807 RepID=A0AAW2YWP8_9EUKA
MPSTKRASLISNIDKTTKRTRRKKNTRPLIKQPFYVKHRFVTFTILLAIASIACTLLYRGSPDINTIQDYHKNASNLIEEFQKNTTNLLDLYLKETAGSIERYISQSIDQLGTNKNLVIEHLDLLSTYLNQQLIEGGKSRGRIGWLLNNTYTRALNMTEHPSYNITSSFMDVIKSIKDQKLKYKIPDEALKYHYVLLPGLYTQFYPGYFKRNVEHLKELNLSTSVIIINDTNVEESSHELYKVFQALVLEKKLGDKQVIMIGHSKGAIDGIGMLSMYPDMKKYIRCFLSVQAPFGGTAFPTDVVHNENARKIVKTIIRLFLRGDISSVEDMCYDKRQEFLLKYPFRACSAGCVNEEECDGIPTVSFTSHDASSLSSMASAIHYVNMRYKERSDGLVTTKDAIIPGSSVVIADEMDHSVPAFQYYPNTSDYDPGDVFIALITVALSDKDKCERFDIKTFFETGL